MELTPECPDYFPRHFYGKILKGDTSLCLICQVDEGEEGKQWDRYALKCGHVFHTRCFGRWCHQKQGINCSYCGDIPETSENRYCDDCGKWGHSIGMDGCAEMFAKMEADMRRWERQQRRKKRAG